ncbi:MAG: phosphopyruvate hydratase [Mycobacteriales bacterium]
MPTIAALEALEILDSRGNPTLQVEIRLSDGVSASAAVPSGASTGRNEAVELRDEEDARYGGRGVLAAVGAVCRQIGDLLVGTGLGELGDVVAADRRMIALDGTPKLSRLGANAVLGVSVAMTRALARSRGVPVWDLLARHLGAEPRLPVPHFNVVNGGAHAANELAFQEFMIAPVGSPSYAEALRSGAEIYHRIRASLSDRGDPVGLGDEGGFAVGLSRPEEVLGLLVEAIDTAGYRADRDGVGIALDPAANGFRTTGGYLPGGERLSSTDMVDWYDELVGRFPIWSLEDGLAEDDWTGWQQLTSRLADRVQVVGDDIFVTDAETVRRAAREHVGTACLVKPNQIGSVAGTLETVDTCRSLGYAQMVSHRSGETTDTFIADLAVGIGCGQIKSGAPARGERLAKYNRLLEIEHRTSLPYGLLRPDKGQ